jgi:hypothetical protein
MNPRLKIQYCDKQEIPCAHHATGKLAEIEIGFGEVERISLNYVTAL